MIAPQYQFMNDKVRSRIEDVLEAARLIQAWALTDSFGEVASDPKLESAYMHQFVRIGEALRIVRDLDPDLAELIPQVHQWIGLRHRLVHDYREIDLELLWTSAQVEVVSLISSLESVLEG